MLPLRFSRMNAVSTTAHCGPDVYRAHVARAVLSHERGVYQRSLWARCVQRTCCLCGSLA
eukprot:2582101-Pleurochrysis_carterae.AAC.1